MSWAQSFEAPRHHTENLKALAFAGMDVWEHGIAGLQLHHAMRGVELFDCQFPVQDGHNDVPMACSNSTINEYQVTVFDPAITHRRATHSHHEGGLLMLHKQVSNIQPAYCVVLGRGGEACTNT